MTAHFYGHLDATQRRTFLREAHRVAPELVVVDASSRRSPATEEWSQRSLGDGSAWEVYERWFTPEQLLTELGAGDVLYERDWFLVVGSPR